MTIETTTAAVATAPKAAKKASKAKPVTKASKNGKAKPTTTAESREIRWSDKKIALLAQLKKMGAVSAMSSVTVATTVAKGGDKILTNINPAWDMTVQGYLGWADPEDSRARCVYVTKKGLKMLENMKK